ncbi:hypothetical protein PROPEN_03336 [Proteus penneri ATCC 35198]|nr:hypothetical protein PROPEN_03336 [Proteus penneri ATCC 35198]
MFFCLKTEFIDLMLINSVFLWFFYYCRRFSSSAYRQKIT